MSSRKRVILGLMTVGPDATYSARVTTLREVTACLDLFQEKGYHEVDTACLYDKGRQEDFTHQAGWKEREAKLDESLRELQTDCLNVFYLHAADRATPWTVTLQALDRFHSQKKFKRLGLSNFSASEVAEIVTTCTERGWVTLTVYQAIYNAMATLKDLHAGYLTILNFLIAQSIKDELVPCCRRYGIDIVIFNPLAGGFLSGKYNASHILAEGRFSEQNKIRGKVLTMVEVALRWCVHHSALKVINGHDGIITGFSSFCQLRSNLDYLEKAKYWHGELVYKYKNREAPLGQRD
ncbi:Aldo/keto reductase [Aspergillus foveolatus]|uniref:Aldo/keto reductase n=1 Tax=Aspergillus foveolatus TaxID=210207 RepID=UPI003CCD2BC7